MVVVTSNVMYSCKAFYIGSASPSTDRKGVEALQAPLRQRYQGNVSQVEGFDVTVTVMPDVVNVVYAEQQEPEFSMPISTLSICAAVRCVDSASDPANIKFIPVHSVITDHEPDSDHPAMFTTVMRRESDTSSPLLCHAFICNSTRDALHLVNATQTAHTALRRGYSATGAMKFFIDQSTEFDRTIRVQQTSVKKPETKKIYMYQEDYDTRQYDAESRTYVVNSQLEHQGRSSTRVYNNYENGDFESNTYYVKTDARSPERQQTIHNSETVVIGLDVEEGRPATPPPQQTIIVDKPIISKAPPIEIPKPRIIERPVYIDPPRPPKMEPQTIYVDKPVFKEFPKWEDPPKPVVIERPVYIDPPRPPKLEPQRIIVDKPILKDFKPPPPYPPPVIVENPIHIDLPEYPPMEPQKIIIDKPIIGKFKPPPAPPKPIIQERAVYIDPPDYPQQQPQTIVVEKPVFNPPKPAPPPPAPIIQEKQVFIDPPPFPRQEPQRIIIEKPILRDPGPPPAAPKPIIEEKPVYIETPPWPKQEPQRIIIEKPVLRDRGPPPPPPKPIIIEKIVYIDPPEWPKQEPQTIVVEKPVIRQRPPPPPMKPIIIEKPVYIDAPAPPPPVQQRIIVEKPVFRGTTYGLSETRRYPSTYGYVRPAGEYRQSYVVRQAAPQVRGLRRYAWSETGGGEAPDLGRSRWEYNSDAGGYRVYGQPRDFRKTENQFINERGFSRRVANEDGVYTGGSAYRVTGGYRRGSTSS